MISALLLWTLFSSAQESCVLGSYSVVGSGLRRCEHSPLGNLAYTGHPLTAEVLGYVRVQNTPEANARFNKLFGTDARGVEEFLSSQDTGPQISMNAETPNLIEDLRAISKDLNSHLGLTGAINELEAERQNRYKSEAIDGSGLINAAHTNATNLRLLQTRCRDNNRAQLELAPVRINFTDQSDTYVFTHVRALPNGFEVQFPNGKDRPIQTRTILRDSTGQYVWTNPNDGKSYPLADKPFELVSSQAVGQIAAFGSSNSNVCNVALDSPPIPRAGEEGGSTPASVAN